MKLILLVLLTITLNAQSKYFTLEKITLLSSTIFYAVSDGLMDGWQWKKNNTVGEESLYYNKLWHRIKPMRNLSSYAVGGSIALDADGLKIFDSWKDFFHTIKITASDLILVSAIYWILFDHFNYMAMGADVKFLHVSDWARQGNNGIWSDVLASPLSKISYLFFAIIQNYFFTLIHNQPRN